jgi:hypothetical protein
MEQLVDEFVAGNGFIPGIGVEDPEQVDVERPCRGAVPRVHSHFFTEDGEFGSRDWNGDDVDDGRYRVSGEAGALQRVPPCDIPVSDEGPHNHVRPAEYPGWLHYL